MFQWHFQNKSIHGLLILYGTIQRQIKVKRATLIQNRAKEGLNMPEMLIIYKLLKVMCVKRLLNEDPLQWKAIPIHYSTYVGRNLFSNATMTLKRLV